MAYQYNVRTESVFVAFGSNALQRRHLPRFEKRLGLTEMMNISIGSPETNSFAQSSGLSDEIISPSTFNTYCPDSTYAAPRSGVLDAMP